MRFLLMGEERLLPSRGQSNGAAVRVTPSHLGESRYVCIAGVTSLLVPFVIVIAIKANAHN